MKQVFVEQLVGFQLAKLPFVFYGTRMFICHIYNNPLLGHILSQLNPVHASDKFIPSFQLFHLKFYMYTCPPTPSSVPEMRKNSSCVLFRLINFSSLL